MKKKALSIILAIILLFTVTPAYAETIQTLVDSSTMHTKYVISTTNNTDIYSNTGFFVNHIVGTPDSGHLTRTSTFTASGDISGSGSGYGSVFQQHNQSLGLQSTKNITYILKSWSIDASCITGRYEVQAIANGCSLSQEVKLIIKDESTGGTSTTYPYSHYVSRVPCSSSTFSSLRTVYKGPIA